MNELPEFSKVTSEEIWRDLRAEEVGLKRGIVYDESSPLEEKGLSTFIDRINSILRKRKEQK